MLGSSMKLEKLAKLRTEVSILESEIGKNLRISSPAQHSPIPTFGKLHLVLVFLPQRRQHTKAHIVLQLIEAQWETTQDSLVALQW